MQIQDLNIFHDYLEKVRQRTMRVARCIPPDKVEWTYQEGKFTREDLLRHLATIERYMFAETVAGWPSCYAGCGKDLAEGYDQILEFCEKLHAESVGIFSQLTPESLRGKCAAGRCIDDRVEVAPLDGGA